MLNILTFLWGDWPGPNATVDGAEYVRRLKRGIERHCTHPHRFICFADPKGRRALQDDDIEVRFLNSPRWVGCLPKYKAYDPENQLKGRVIVMDLDTIITGSLDEMFSYNGEFATRSTFVQPYQSGGDMLGFEAGFGTWIWELFKSDPDKVLNEITEGGRERFLYRKMCKPEFWQLLYPGKYFSYKRHVRPGADLRDRGNPPGLPPGSCLVSCHGQPRPHDIDEQWVKDNWA